MSWFKYCMGQTKLLLTFLLLVGIGIFLIPSLSVSEEQTDVINFNAKEIINSDVNAKFITKGNITIESTYNTVCSWRNSSDNFKYCEVILEVTNHDLVHDFIEKNELYSKFKNDVEDMEVYTSKTYSWYNDSILNITCFDALNRIEQDLCYDDVNCECYYDYPRRLFTDWKLKTKLDKFQKGITTGVKLVFKSPMTIENNSYAVNQFNFTIFSDFLNTTLDPDISECAVLETAGEIYKLTADITDSTSLNCMIINASNITLDCQGHTIDGQNNGSTGGIISYGYNTTIHNCTITDWAYGIMLSIDADNSTIKGCTIQNMNNYGINFILHTDINGGVTYTNAGDNLFYNNFLNNTYNVRHKASNNTWNTTNQTGTRIFSNGTQIGGNYWTNPTATGYSDTCIDINEDGFCDYALNISNMVACTPGTDCNDNVDHLPLSDEYPDSTSPVLTLTQPVTQVYSTNMSLPLNYSVSDNVAVDQCWFNIINSTGGFEKTNTTITDCVNTTFNISDSDTYILTLYANDTWANENSTAVTFSVSLVAPAVVLDYPVNGTYFDNSTDIYFNYTATDTDGLDVCMLYGDFNGTWQVHRVNTTIVSGVQDYMTIDFTATNNRYSWNVWCNDTAGVESWALENKTLTIDMVYPDVSVTSPVDESSFTGLSFWLLYKINDTNIDTCYFTLRDSAGNVHNYGENTSLVCNSTYRLLSSTKYDNFILYVYGKDKAGNINLSYTDFTNYDPGAGGGGGGGGIWVTPSNFTISPAEYRALVFADSDETITFVIHNPSSEMLTVTLSFESDDGSASWFEPAESSVQVPGGNELSPGRAYVEVTIHYPSEVENEIYTTRAVFTSNTDSITIPVYMTTTIVPNWFIYSVVFIVIIVIAGAWMRR